MFSYIYVQWHNLRKVNENAQNKQNTCQLYLFCFFNLFYRMYNFNRQFYFSLFS